VSPKKESRSKQWLRVRPVDASRKKREQAQQLMERAFDAADPRRQVALARQALETSPDCVDAYLLLGDAASNADEALPLFEQAVEAAERVLGPDTFRECAGHFWAFPDTRPYMQARLDLAQCLLELGRSEEAIVHYREMLDLNPNDNQGCRYRLASVLLLCNRIDELQSLLQKYPDDYTAEWYYTRALLAFQGEGDSEAARTLLREAHQVNRFVPTYLVGAKRLPAELPEYISPGQESEAISFVAEFLPHWRSTPGAIPWVRQTVGVGPALRAPESRPVAWNRAREVLQQLPLSAETEWEVDLVRLASPNAREDGGWTFLIVDATTTEQLLLETWPERPRDSELWRHLIDAMRSSRETEPHRPAVIRLTRKSLAKTWGPKLAQIGVRCELTDELAQIAAFIERFEAFVASKSQQATDQPVDDAELEQLPQAVGEVWRAAVRKLPTWMQVGSEMCRPTVFLVLDTTNDLLLATSLIEREPPDGWLWSGLSSAMSQPGAGNPRRPGVVQLSPDAPLSHLGPRLESIGVRCVVNEDSSQLDALIADLTERVVGPSRLKSLIRSLGMTPSQLGGFYAAAADFYRAAPWQHISGDSVIRVETNVYSSGPWYAVIMGQRGMELGVALYEDLALLREILGGRLSEKEHARRTAALSVTFGEVFDIAPEDADAIEEYDWPVATEEAYPSILRVNPGLALRTPLPWEVELLEACLRALPEFVHKGLQGSISETVATATRDITLQLSRLE